MFCPARSFGMCMTNFNTAFGPPMFAGINKRLYSILPRVNTRLMSSRPSTTVLVPMGIRFIGFLMGMTGG